MYFIPRNNAIYNYVAHTTTKRRYYATLFVFISIIIIGYYGIYMPLTAHITLYKLELTRLQKQYAEGEQLEKNNKDLTLLVDAHKKNIIDHVIDEDKWQEQYNKRMRYIFDLITQMNLTLNSYGPGKEKDKKWYIKDSAPYLITGSLEKLLSFLKAIKDSQQMITLSHLSITQVKDNLFQLNGDIGIVLMKK